MKDVISSILTDTSSRTDGAVEDALLRQAVASPWFDEAQ
jgi:hypothetical protein